jgi:hypothetical protein
VIENVITSETSSSEELFVSFFVSTRV